MARRGTSTSPTLADGGRPMIRVGVVVFPGSNCDIDARPCAPGSPAPSRSSCGTSRRDLDGVDAIVLPGGFAYGDYLRAGVIARFSPVMRAVAAFAAEGGLVLGICNGFQVLTEAGLLPGALLRNRSLRFVVARGRDRARAARHAVHARARPVADRSGCRSPTARAATSPTPRRSTTLERERRVLFRYVQADGRPAGGEEDRANPNGSLRAIAGVTNAAGNVAGLMPHPETRRRRLVLGSDDGLGIIRSLVESAAERPRREPDRRDGECAMTRWPPRPPREVPLHRRLGLTDDELVAIDDRLGRAPNALELAMFSVMWSEHCSYKSSKPLLPDAADRRRRRRRRARARTPASSRSATGWRSRSRSSRTTIRAPSSRTRAPRPASAASSATSSRWAPGRSPCSTRSGSATRPTHARGTSSTASSAASAATATASACRRSAASSCSIRRTRATRWST